MNENESWNGRKLYCYMCGHFWTVRNDKPPKTCPRCRSSRYDTPIKREHKCTYCGNVWTLGSITDKCPNADMPSACSPIPRYATATNAIMNG